MVGTVECSSHRIFLRFISESIQDIIELANRNILSNVVYFLSDAIKVKSCIFDDSTRIAGQVAHSNKLVFKAAILIKAIFLNNLNHFFV